MSVMHHLARVVIGHDNGTEHELRDLIVDAYSVQRQRVAELEANIQSMGRATDGLRKSSEVMANELPRALARVAELEGERDELKTQLRIEVAELSNEEGMRAQCEDEALSASLRAKVAESRAEELQAQLDRANASKLRIQRDSDRESKCERDESEHQCDACARCFQRVSEQLDRANGELREWHCDTVPGRCRGCPDCQPVGGTMPVTLERNAADDRKPAEPRPVEGGNPIRPTDMPYMRDYVTMLRFAAEGTVRPDSLERVLNRLEWLEMRNQEPRPMSDAPRKDFNKPVLVWDGMTWREAAWRKDMGTWQFRFGYIEDAKWWMPLPDCRPPTSSGGDKPNG